MNIFSVTFFLFVYLIRTLSNDKKGFCRNSRNFLTAGHIVFFKTLPLATKEGLFQQICPVYSREIYFRVYLRKILKIKIESY